MAQSRVTRYGLLFIGWIFAVGVVFKISTPQAAAAPAAKQASPAQPAAPDEKTIKENAFGCISPEDYKDAWSYLRNKEKALFSAMYTSGKCDLFEKGQKVILLDYKFMDYATVRRPGSTEKFVMYPEVFK